jgi:hypothetical protein
MMARNGPGRSSPRSFEIFLIIFAVFFLLAVGSNLQQILQDITPMGDLACDMLLMEQSRDSPLLFGHFSRYEFNHPGPFFLYVRILFEQAISVLLPGPFNAHFVAGLFGSAFFLALVAFTLHRMFDDGRFRGVRAAVVGTAVLAFVLASGDFIGGMWMPHVLPAPFAAFSLLLVALANGRGWALVPGIFCGGALVHGYVTMPAFVSGAFLPALALGWWNSRRPGQRFAGPRDGVLGALTIALFLLPMAADAALHQGGNIAAIVKVAGQARLSAHPDLGLALRFTAGFFADVAWPVWLGAGASLALCLSHRPRLHGLRHAATVFAIVTIVFLAVVMRSPDPEPTPYTGFFYIGAIAIPLVLLICAGTEIVFVKSRLLYVAVTAVLLVMAFPERGFTIRYLPAPWVRDISQRIIETIDRDGLSREDTMVGLTFDADRALMASDLIAGIMLDLGRFGVRSCTDVVRRAYAYTPRRICPSPSPPGTTTVRFEATYRSLCQDRCSIESAQWGLIPLSRPRSDYSVNRHPKLGSSKFRVAYGELSFASCTTFHQEVATRVEVPHIEDIHLYHGPSLDSVAALARIPLHFPDPRSDRPPFSPHHPACADDHGGRGLHRVRNAIVACPRRLLAPAR